ncbi:MAG: glycoside hydrolase family 130 protein [Fibrobacteria bacterium]|nr:glycoside hydrolase family 130 protein [Fibrobacteria bacterium]
MKKIKGPDLLHRWEGNPIITQENIPFRCNSVFNGSPLKCGEDYFLLLRVEGQLGYSFFALARSQDGLHWDVDSKPVMVPDQTGPYSKYESSGLEDPRITTIDGIHYILYTAASPYGSRIAISTTKDFSNFDRIAFISEPGNKDGVLFPNKINGLYARLDRPIANGVGSIWVSYSDDLIHWGGHRHVMSPRPGHWDADRIGASVPPIQTKEGWLEIYHGFRMNACGPVYRMGTVLLDLDDPSRVISRKEEAILSPRKYYERVGDVNNVVFGCGAILEDNDELKIYYGGADTCLCVATVDINVLLEATIKND